MNERNKRLFNNTFSSLALQITTIISGFILPKLIIAHYGSNTNGLINSITQFLGVITLLDLGMGAVVQSSLYKPLSDNDSSQISRIYVSASRFFKRIAYILTLYIVALIILYPTIINNSYSFIYTATLIASIGISSFLQYYFGIVNTIILRADQKGYLQYNINILTIILNTITSCFLIYFEFPIQIIKLSTSIIYAIRPIYLYLYVRGHYSIDTKIIYKEEPIKQKWNGIAQHLAYYVLESTDSIVLTIFSSLENISIYSVYNNIIMGVKNALLSMTNGFQSLLGEMIAKKETEKLNNFFGYVEWILHTGTTLVFGCTGVLLISFVKVYTNGITDADYIQPLFAVLITVANAGHCLRLPYNTLILAAGHYKQTQSNYIIAMILNIVISIATVKIWGLVGVAIGTLVAMIYQTVWMAWYDSKNIINWPFKNFLKQIGVDITTVIIASLVTFKIPMLSVSYCAWIVQALEVFICWLIIVLLVNYIFYKGKISFLLGKIKHKIARS